MGTTLAPHVVRVTSAICPLWNDAVDVGKLDTLTKIARVRPERDHKGRRCSTYLLEPSISNNDNMKLGRMFSMLDFNLFHLSFLEVDYVFFCFCVFSCCKLVCFISCLADGWA